MNTNYRNFSLGDYLYSDKKHEEEMAKLTALNAIAGKSSTGNYLIYGIVGVGFITMLILLGVYMKRKKS
jgi:hypothetical protein